MIWSRARSVNIENGADHDVAGLIDEEFGGSGEAAEVARSVQ
jgi:hypothetical protein